MTKLLWCYRLWKMRREQRKADRAVIEHLLSVSRDVEPVCDVAPWAVLHVTASSAKYLWWAKSPEEEL